MNDTLQWAAIVFLTVLILGLFREISLSVPASRRAIPEGPSEGSRLPRDLLEELASRVPQFKAASGMTLAFVTEDCIGCRQLLAALASSGDDLNGTLALVMRQPSRAFSEATAELTVAKIVDTTGRYWDLCQVTATPLVIHIDSSGRVLRKEVTHDVRRVALAT